MTQLPGVDCPLLFINSHSKFYYWLKKIPSFFTLLLLVFGFLETTAQVTAGTAPVNPPAGGFHIEGNLGSNTPTVGVGDWVPGSAGSGGNVLTAAGVPVNAATTFHLTDPYNVSENNFAGGKKFNDNPADWTWVTNAAVGKCDIHNALFHFTTSNVGGVVHTWLVLAADRRVNNGNAYIDFELLQNTMTDNANGSFSTAGPNRGRTKGDILLTLALTNGGGAAEFFVNKWDLNGSGVYDYLDKTSVIPASSVFASTNAGTVPVSFGAFGGSQYSANLFVEAAIDLTAVLGAIDPCTSLGVKTLFIKTKTSQSPTATIVDFISAKQVALQIGVANAGPGQVRCGNVFSVTGQATPSPGDAISSTSWSVVSGAANIASPSSATSSITVTGSPAVIKFTVNTTFGCVATDTLTLTVKSSPGVTVNSPSVCAGSSATLTATSAAASPSYLWSPGGATTSSITVSPASTTSYSVTVTDGVSGCSGSGSGTVTIKPTPGAPTVGVVNNCDGSSDLTATNYTGTLLWSNGATTASIHVTNAATYTVTQTVDGCISSSGSGTSAPRTAPGAPTVGVVNNCDGSSDLTATNYTGTLLWSNGATTASIHVTNAATYTVTQTVNGCTSLPGSGTSAPKTTPSAPSVTYNAPACNVNTFSVSVSSVLSGATYTIFDKNGNSISGVSPASPYVAPDGSNFAFSNIPAGSGYMVTATSNGCISDDNSCGVVSLVSKPAAKAQPTTSNILSDSKTKVLAAPNPFNDRVRFSLESAVSGQGSLELYTLLGQKVKTVFQGYVEKGKSRTIEYSMPASQRGVIVYVFKVGNQRTTGRIIGLK